LQTTPTTAAPRSAATRWTRILLPSISDLIFIAILFSLSCGSFAPRLLGDAGIGWHIRNGEQMLRTHAITRTDWFSSTMSGKPWFAWEWLYDLLIARTHEIAGLNGVVFVTALIVAFTFALVFRLTLTRGGSLPLAVMLLALSLGASAIHLFARPHVLSWLFAVVWFQALDSWSVSGDSAADRKLFWLPPLIVLWVNLHGGFLLGLVLLGLFLAAAFLEYLGARDSHRQPAARRLKQIAVVTALSLAATLINPYGYQLHIHVYQYLSDRFLMDHIQEFASPNFHGAAERCFALLLLLTIVALAYTRERMRTSQVLVLIFAIGSGLYASRNLPVSSLLLTMLAVPILSRSLTAVGFNPEIASSLRRFFTRWASFATRMESTEMSLSGHFWPTITVLVGLWICIGGGRVGSRQIMDAHFPEQRFPVQAVDAITGLGTQDPILCPDYWGGYLIYRLYPRTKVVVDDRHDLYGSAFLKQYLRTEKGEPGWDELLQQEHVRAVLTPAQSPLANILTMVPAWRITYKDDAAIFFQRPPY
jgi:hypothetical protein